MFAFEPDEYIFSKFAHYFKHRQKQKEKALLDRAVLLETVKPKLTLLARAISGKAITLYEAEREGGYKNNSFFLPATYAQFPSKEGNLSFYFFRILFLSAQKKLGLNWPAGGEYSVQESRQKAATAASIILPQMFREFPISKKFHAQLISHYIEKSNPKAIPDFSMVYGKWMQNSTPTEEENLLENVSEKTKEANPKQPKTVIRAKATEEIISVTVDKKQMEDAVLQHQFEKVETAEEFGGNFRDMDAEDDLNDHANALDELRMKYTVRVDDTVHSVYQADFLENTTVQESTDREGKGPFLFYPEWDYKKRTYKKNFCKVYPTPLFKRDMDYYSQTLSKHKIILMGLRKQLTSLHNKYQQQHRQSRGDVFDLDALVDRFVAVHCGKTPEEHIYLSKRKKEKDLAVLLLLDNSLSSDAFVNGNRVIDVEKQVSLLFGEILNEFAITFSIGAFHSKTRNHSYYVMLKAFDEDWNKAKYKMGALTPSGYTRIGPAIRHSGALLDSCSAKNKWLILISDGKPNDYDRYEGKYGIHDVKQALRELNHRHINTYALAIEAQAKYYLPQMFGQNHYQILNAPEQLLVALMKLFEKIKHQS